jgi:hypothetical protein
MCLKHSARIGVQEYVQHARLKVSSRESRRAVVGRALTFADRRKSAGHLQSLIKSLLSSGPPGVIGRSGGPVARRALMPRSNAL